MKAIAIRKAGDVGAEAWAPATTYAAVFGIEPRRRREEERQPAHAGDGRAVVGRPERDAREQPGRHHRAEAVAAELPVRRLQPAAAQQRAQRVLPENPAEPEGESRRRAPCPPSAAPRPSWEPKRAPAARFSSGRGTNATVHQPVRHREDHDRRGAVELRRPAVGEQPLRLEQQHARRGPPRAAPPAGRAATTARAGLSCSGRPGRWATVDLWRCRRRSPGDGESFATVSSVAAAGGVAVAVPPEWVVASSIR